MALASHGIGGNERKRLRQTHIKFGKTVQKNSDNTEPILLPQLLTTSNDQCSRDNLVETLMSTTETVQDAAVSCDTANRDALEVMLLTCEAEVPLLRADNELVASTSGESSDRVDKATTAARRETNNGQAIGVRSLPLDIAELPSGLLSRPKLKRFPRTVFGDQSRSFSLSLYEKYDFIEYSREADAVFCNTCRFHGSKNGHREESMITEGFRNWRKPERIGNHAGTDYHINSVSARLAFFNSQAAGDVRQKLLSYHEKVVLDNRAYIKSLAHIALLCGKQNLPLRGHHEGETSGNKGTFLEIVDFLGSESKEFQQRRERMASNANYLSSDSQNALLEAGARNVLRKIQTGAQSSGMYAIITDCCTDLVTDNLSLSIRYVDMSLGEVHEHFIQFEDLSHNELDAENITSKILSMLKQPGRFELNITDCVAQASDGASVMSGRKGGVQQLLRKETGNPCVFVHCYAHRLNLVLSVSAAEVECVKEFFDILRKTITFINVSCKRKGIFHDLQESDPNTKDTIVLPEMCEHKWNFRERAVDVVHRRYPHLLETLDSISENGKPDERAEAEGLLKQWMLPLNLCLVVVFSDIFAQLGPLSNTFQAVKTDLSSVLNLAKTHISILRQKRSEAHFAQVWQVASALAAKCNIVMVTPIRRVRKAPSRLRNFLVDTTVGDRSVDDITSNTPEEYCRATMFYSVMDKLILEMERRFGENDPVLRGIAACSPDSCEFLLSEILTPFWEAYDIGGSIEAQLEVCRTYLKNNTTRPESIGDLISRLKPAEGFPELRRLLQIALTVPIANVAAERSFSTLRQIRTYERNAMREERLSSLSTLSIEKDIALSLNLDSVVDTFSRLPTLRAAPHVSLQASNVRRLSLN